MQQQKQKTRYEIVDKDGNVLPWAFHSLWAVNDYASKTWPDQEQDEDRTGKGWDVQVCGCDDLR